MMHSPGESLSVAAAAQLAELHGEALEASTLSLLGPRVLRQYYRFAAASNLEIILVEEAAGQVTGAAVVSLEPGSLARRFLRCHPVRALAGMATTLFLRPGSLGKLMGFLLSDSRPPAVVGGLPEVLQLFTSPLHRGKGVGRSLLAHAEVRLRAAGFPAYFVKTRQADGNPAVGFYQALGFQVVQTRAYKGAEYAYFRKTI